MKQNILIFDYLDSLVDLYNYIKENNISDNYNVYYSKAILTQNDNVFTKIKKIYYKIKYYGFFSIFKFFIFRKKNIVLTAGASGIYRFISTKVILFDHGWGNKKTPSLMELADTRKLQKYRKVLKNTDYIVCINDYDQEKYLNDKLLNDIPKPVFVPLGMPRNDWLINNKDNDSIKSEAASKLGIKNYTNYKIVLYAPTYRDIPAENTVMMDRLISEFDVIDEKLKDNNIILLFRPHYFDSIFFEKLKKYKSIYYAGQEVYENPRKLMILSNLLLTDYSSIYVDYLLLEKPIVFYALDLEKYMQYRGLVTDYNNPIETPGPKISRLSELIEVIQNKKYYKKKQLILAKDYYFKYPDAKTCERVKCFIENL